MFQGSKSYNKEYFTPFTPIGGQVNGTTNTDRTNYYEQVPAEALELALWMESDRMEGLLEALTQAKLDNQRDVVKNERRQRYENTPYGMVWKIFPMNSILKDILINIQRLDLMKI
jgi:predicted Zn-dependent peptidase